MGNYIECERCEGTGLMMVPKLLPSGHTEVYEECEECDGIGEIEEEKING